MSNFLNYSEVDTGVQRRLAGSSASDTVRLGAINDAMNEIYTEYDLDSGIRSMVGYFVPNGAAIDITSFVSDFKHSKDLRRLGLSKHENEFPLIDDDDFVAHVGSGRKLDEHSVSYKDGKLYLRINAEDQPISKILHGMNDLTEDGTWAVDATNGDATNIGTTAVRVLEQSADITFDIDVSQTVNNVAIIENTDFDAIDLSDYIQLGLIQFWIFLPSITNFTSVEFRWGSSKTVYWSDAATTQADGTPLRVGWNYIEIDWADATETGSVDEENIDYSALVLNYNASFTDQTKVTVEKFRMWLPVAMELFYFTYFLSQDNAGTFQEEMDAVSTDELLLPRRYKKLVELGAMRYLVPIVYGDDGLHRLGKIEKDYKIELKNLDLDLGNRPKVGSKKFKIRKQW